jgi:hypothetical protein
MRSWNLVPPLSRVTLAVALLAVAPFSLAQTPEVDPPDERTTRYGTLFSFLGGELRVPATEIRRGGPVISFGGDVVVEGSVEDVIVIFGTLRLTGTVRHQVVGVFSELQMEGADVGGEVINVLGSLEEERSRLRSSTVDIPFPIPGIPVWNLILWFRLARLFIIFLVLVLLVALVPERIRVIAEEAPVRYVTAFFVGLLGYLGSLIVFTLLSATVIGIPVAILTFYILKWVGVAGIFCAVGRRMGSGFGREMSILGAVLLTFGLYALATLLPTPLGLFGLGLVWGVVGLLFFLLIEVPAVGLVILTRAGGATVAPPQIPPRPATTVPPAPPVGPTPPATSAMDGS